MSFLISAPLLKLCQASGAHPERINAVVDARLARGQDTRMRPGDHYPSLLRRKTGVPVVGVARASRHLLVEIESRHPHWRYRERTRNQCTLWIPATVPETLKIALVGRPARALVLTIDIIDDLKIGALADDGDWTRVSLSPDWTLF